MADFDGEIERKQREIEELKTGARKNALDQLAQTVEEFKKTLSFALALKTKIGELHQKYEFTEDEITPLLMDGEVAKLLKELSAIQIKEPPSKGKPAFFFLRGRWYQGLFPIISREDDSEDEAEDEDEDEDEDE
jgi:hypothetical protein